MEQAVDDAEETVGVMDDGVDGVVDCVVDDNVDYVVDGVFKRHGWCWWVWLR